MVPTPEETIISDENDQIKTPVPLTGEEVVISGMSGIFPRSDHVIDFKENLYNKVDMVTDRDVRWKYEHPEVPKHFGIINGLTKFDAQFFKVHYKQAWTMEPMCRKLLENAYGAIFDAGFNPIELKGQNVGVFVGSSYSDSDKSVLFEQVQRNGLGITGCCKTMYANRISYWLDVKGPSYGVDLACASSTSCLEQAYKSIRTGQCDSAIVGGCCVALYPSVALMFKRAGFLCMDGKTKCFDKNGDGYVRSDAISAIFLQKAKNAKRIYAEVYHVDSEYRLQPDSEFLPIRRVDDIKQFLENFYSKIKVSPEEVEYVEATGSGIAAADGNEMEAIGQFFAKNRSIKIGSVKSNMGNSEAASGNCAVTKICLAYHEGKLPANLHYNEPQEHIPSVREGRIQVVQENVPFGRGYTAINSFSFTGANLHVLLKGHYKAMDKEKYLTNLPYLVLASGRQELGVTKILDDLEKHPLNPEKIGLLHDIHSKDISGHMCRGYTILSTNEENETISLSRSVEYCPGVARPVWFVYSGMGSQWAGMGTELMRIPSFAAAIERCHRVLSPKGIDIVRILTEPDKSIYDNILHSFVGIAAVQIGLTDVLTEMGIVPDNIIGHSVGELGCAYADGCFTAEEMILAAYSRGLVSVQTPFIRGSMAAVGLGYNDVLPLCPPAVEVACHNSSESSTISGPAEIMKKFVEELVSKKVFAKEVPCSNIAYHSRYIAEAGPGLLKYLREVIPNPKERSKKWLSTSVPHDKWDDHIAKFSSAEYHTNNLLSSVLFEETSKLIPSNALVIEVAPHGLLQAILKRSLSECIHIPLTRRGHSNPVKFLLEAIGKLYETGLNPKVDILYPKIQYPVSTETPLLSHLVEWEHSEEWLVAKYNPNNRITTIDRNVVISLHDDDYKYFEGFIRNGKIVFPEAAFLVLIWETLAMSKGVYYKELPVIFQNVKFHSEVTIRKDEPVRLLIGINKGNKKFEVSCDNNELISGVIEEFQGSEQECHEENNTLNNDNDVILSSKDVYKLLHYKGHSYRHDFQPILSTNGKATKAYIKWNEDWILFLDALFQLNILSRNFNGVSVPKIINRLVISTDVHGKNKQEDENQKIFETTCSGTLGFTRCRGVEMKNVYFTDQQETIYDSFELLSKTFVPYHLAGVIDISTVLQINIQIVVENLPVDKINIIELNKNADLKLCEKVNTITKKMPEQTFNIKGTSIENENFDIILTKDPVLMNSHLLITDDFLGDEMKMNSLHNFLPKNTFVLAIEHDTSKIHPKYKLFNVITANAVGKHILILLKKTDAVQKENVIYIPVTNGSFTWISQSLRELEKSNRIVLFSERKPLPGIIGLVKELRKKYLDRISLIVVDDYHTPSFNPEHRIFKEQIQKKMTVSVLKQGHWGGYYYVHCATTAKAQNFTLTSSMLGDLDSLKWIEGKPEKSYTHPVQVHFSGPSKIDVQKASGEISNDTNTFGMDFSGTTKKGQRVMGIISEGAISNVVDSDIDLLWLVPEHWSLEDAATVPLPYVYAYYCLAIKSEIYKGCSIFITEGTSALGQAVISICLALECNVITTVSDQRAKRFLLKVFPQLKDSNVITGRKENFYNQVINITNNKRCEIVISNFNGAQRELAMHCVAFKGFFMDISGHDARENKDFGLSYLSGERSYKFIDFSSVFRHENIEQRKLLQLLIAQGITKGYVKPLTRVVYSLENVTKAFRLVSYNRNRGKVLIKMRDPTNKLIVTPCITYSLKGSYVVLCDETDFGIELADYLIRRGVKYLTINMTTNSNKEYIYVKKTSWKTLGVSVKFVYNTLKSEKDCADLLKETMHLGPVHGIYVVQTFTSQKNTDEDLEKEITKKFNNTAANVSNLDLISRKLCSELREFVVIANSPKSLSDQFVASATEQICETRNEVNLPVLYLRAEFIDEFENLFLENNLKGNIVPQKTLSVLKALEISLKLPHYNINTFLLKSDRQDNFLEKMSRILGVQNIDNLSENLTLNNFILNDSILKQIKSVIKDFYNIECNLSRLQDMSIADLKNMNNSIAVKKTNFDIGLGAFYSYVEEDELLGLEPVVIMPTKLSNGIIEEEEEVDPTATYLMFIPSFEGHHRTYLDICERLKVQAITLQLSPNLAEESIQQMALNVCKNMKKRFKLNAKFYLMGYSFGVNVALEVAALLEREGYIGVVYCLDSSPDALRVHLDAYLGNVTEEQLQNIIAEHMFKLISGQQSQDLGEELNNIKNWSDKVNNTLNRLRGLVKYSSEYQRYLIETAYRRILWSRDYEPEFKLNSELILMRGIPHPKADKLPRDYNLSKYTNHPVQVFDLESDHTLAPQDLRVANIVNKFLDVSLLEEFKKKNLCETYVADAVKLV